MTDHSPSTKRSGHEGSEQQPEEEGKTAIEYALEVEELDLQRLLEEEAVPDTEAAETEDPNDALRTEPPVRHLTLVPLPSLNDEPDDARAFADAIKWDRQVPDIKKPWMAHHEFRLVQSLDEVNEIVDRCIEAGECSLDLETEGLDNRSHIVNDVLETVHKIVGFCISYDGHTGFYIPVRHKPVDGGPGLNVQPLSGVEAAITRLCRAAIPEATQEAIERDQLSYKAERPKLVIYFWNAQFDQEFLYPVTGIDWWHPLSFEDGMLAAYCIYSDDKALSLKAKALERLADRDGNPYEMIKLAELFHGNKKLIKFATLSPDEPGVLRYAGSDAICTLLLCRQLVRECAAKHADTYRLEKQTTQVVRTMERNRVYVLRDEARQLLEETEAKRDKLLAEIKEYARAECQVALEPNSPKQLSEFLFGKRPHGMDISPKPERNEASSLKAKVDQYKTDAATLTELSQHANAAPILKMIVRFRELEKLVGTYLRPLANSPDANGEIRVGFKQTGAASGRFSAPAGDPSQGFSGIPIHGIPGDAMRRCFSARPGYVLIKADYSAEELRIAANLSGEQVWIKEFLYGEGDLHSITARAVFARQEITKAERSQGKTMNFALVYGGGPQAVMRATGCDSLEGTRRKQAFDRAVPTFAGWCRGQHEVVKRDLGVYTAFGRWIQIQDARHPDKKIQSSCERKAVNYPVQGAGADIMKIAMVLLHKRFHKLGYLKSGDDSVRMLLTVHDEVVFEVKSERVTEVVPIITEIMESPWRLPRRPVWQVPLVVEPLIGFNWASGYKAERAKEGLEIKEGEQVLRNGFVYNLLRKPEDGEALDRGEIEVNGKFRLEEAPPWLDADPRPVTSAPAVKPESRETLAEVVPLRPLQQRSEPTLKAGEVTSATDKLERLTFLLTVVNTDAVEQIATILKTYANPSAVCVEIKDSLTNDVLVEPTKLCSCALRALHELRVYLPRGKGDA